MNGNSDGIRPTKWKDLNRKKESAIPIKTMSRYFFFVHIPLRFDSILLSSRSAF